MSGIKVLLTLISTLTSNIAFIQLSSLLSGYPASSLGFLKGSLVDSLPTYERWARKVEGWCTHTKIYSVTIDWICNDPSIPHVFHGLSTLALLIFHLSLFARLLKIHVHRNHATKHTIKHH